MKKTKVLLACLALVALLFAVGCPDAGKSGEPLKSDEAKLLSVTVDTFSYIGLVVDGRMKMPDPTPGGSWSGVSLTGSGSMEYGTIVVTDSTIIGTSSTAGRSVQVAATVSDKAKVKYGKSTTNNNKPNAFKDLGSETFSSGNNLFIQVTSESDNVVNYYRFRLAYQDPATGIELLTVGNSVGIEEAPVAVSGGAWNTAPETAIKIDVDKCVNADVTLVLVTTKAKAKIVKVTGAGTPDFANATFGNTANFTFGLGDFIYIEVTPESSITPPAYYKYKITLPSNAELKGPITIAGQPAEGIPAGLWNVGTGGTVTFSKNYHYNNPAIVATPDDSKATVTYAYESNAGTEPAFGPSASFTLTAQQGGVFYIKVVAQDGITILIYRFTVVSGLSKDARLATLTIGTAPVTSGNWGTPNANLSEVVPGSVTIPSRTNTQLGAIAVVAVPEDNDGASGATIKYAKVTGSGDPTFGTTTSFAFTTAEKTGSFIYIEVTAADTNVKLIYKIAVTLTLSTNADISAATVAAQNVYSVMTAGPAASWTAASAGSFTFTKAQATNATISGTRGDATNATIQYGVSTDGSEPTWSTTGTGYSFTHGNFVGIKVTAQDPDVVKFYKLTVAFSDNANLTAINGATGAALGTPGPVYNAATPGAITVYSDSDPGTIEITATKGNSDASLRYAVVGDGSAPSFGTSNSLTAKTGDTVYIEVTAAAGNIQVYAAVVTIENAPPHTGGLFGLRIGPVSLDWATTGISSNASHTAAAISVYSGGVASAGRRASNIGHIMMTREQCQNADVSVWTKTTGASVKVFWGNISTVTGANAYVVPAPTASNFTSDKIAARNWITKDYVQVQYTPTSGGTAVYYTFFIRRKIDVPYIAPGTVTITQSAGAFTPETVWDTAPYLQIDRVWPGDSGSFATLSTTDFSLTNPETFPTVKLLWSTDGLYLLANVKDSTVSTGVTNTSSTHLNDSLEVFIHEGYVLNTNDNNVWAAASGGQYRIGRDGFRSGSLDTNTMNTRITRQWNVGTTDYQIKARIAWQTASGTVSGWDNRLIGGDFQINYCTGTTRHAGVNWNTSMQLPGYQNATNPGLIYLKK